jgi:hypothetical protein
MSRGLPIACVVVIGIRGIVYAEEPIEGFPRPAVGDVVPKTVEYKLTSPRGKVVPKLTSLHARDGQFVVLALWLQVENGEAFVLDPYLQELGSEGSAELFLYTAKDGRLLSVKAIADAGEPRPPHTAGRFVPSRSITGRVAYLKHLNDQPTANDVDAVEHYAQFVVRRRLCVDPHSRLRDAGDQFVACSEAVFIGTFSAKAAFSLENDFARLPDSEDFWKSSALGAEAGLMVDAMAWFESDPKGKARLAVACVNGSRKPIHVWDPSWRMVGHTEFPGQLVVTKQGGGWSRNLAPGRFDRMFVNDILRSGMYILPGPSMYQILPPCCLSGRTISVATKLEPGNYVVDLTLDERWLAGGNVTWNTDPDATHRKLFSKRFDVAWPP